MMRGDRWRWAWVLVVLAGVAGLAAGVAVRYAATSASSAPDDATRTSQRQRDNNNDKLGQPAPAFELADRAGKKRSPGEFSNKVVLVNFWATWCPPCRREMPVLNDLHQEWRGRGLRILGVALQSEKAVRAFSRESSIEYPLLAGGREAFRIAGQYGDGQHTLPYSVVIDRSGIIRAVHHGALSRQEAHDLVEPYL